MLEKKRPLNEKIKFHKNLTNNTYDFQISKNVYLKGIIFVFDLSVYTPGFTGDLNYFCKCIMKCGGIFKTIREVKNEGYKNKDKLPRDSDGKIRYDCHYYIENTHSRSREGSIVECSRYLRLYFQETFFFNAGRFSKNDTSVTLRKAFNDVFEKILEEKLKLEFLENL